MPELWEMTKLIRSKNAGPFEITFDIMFKTEQDFEIARSSAALSKSAFSRLYKIPDEEIQHFVLKGLSAITVTIPRKAFSGDPADTDVYGGQFHSPLVRLMIEDPRTE